jgi:hypothetical protein
MTPQNRAPAQNQEPKVNQESNVRKAWVEPEVRELDVRETSAFPGLGFDAGGNPSPDCQRS